MLCTNYTTNRRKFKHISLEVRIKIETMLNCGVPKSQIARSLGIARSTLYNELVRGTVIQINTRRRQYKKYFYDVGQRVYTENRKNLDVLSN